MTGICDSGSPAAADAGSTATVFSTRYAGGQRCRIAYG